MAGKTAPAHPRRPVTPSMIHSAPSPAAATAAPRDEAVVVRRATSLADYAECVAIQGETWGTEFSERVPVSVLIVSQKIGGVVAVAADPAGRLLGFVFGMTGIHEGALIHWSDMLAVRPEARGHGIGERLKWHQRDLVRALGVEMMRWTFDPLVARNAGLNLGRLGARVIEYVPNMYGSGTRSPLHGTGDTDRVVVSWDLAPAGAGGEARSARSGSARGSVPVINAPGVDGVPVLHTMPDAGAVRIAIPHDAQAIAPSLHAAWRRTTRDAFLGCLARGYVVTGFHRGSAQELPGYDLELGSAPGAAGGGA